MSIFYHSNIILSILKIKLNSFVNILFMLYNNIVSKRKKIIITLSVVIGAILILVASLLLVFLLKPDKGEQLRVDTINNRIYISAQQEDERTYVFKFANGDEVKTFDSASSQFDITELLWSGELSFGTSYEISYCLVEPSGILAGEFSEPILYTPVIRLDAPVVSFNEETFLISWETVRGAEFYNIYYYDGSDLIASQVEGTSFDLTQIKGGDRQVFVTSSSNQSFFYESELSNVISTTITHTLAPFDNAFIDENYDLHIITIDNIDGVDVLVGEQKYFVSKNDFVITKTQTGYEIIFSAKSFYKPGQQIKVMPHADEFNIYTSEPTIVTDAII